MYPMQHKSLQYRPLIESFVTNFVHNHDPYVAYNGI